MRKSSVLEMINLNTYWLGLSFLWTSLHVTMLPALLLEYVSDERKNTALGLLTFLGLIIAMIIQPVSGAVSDRWSSRFGRRRPAIAIGTAADFVFLSLMAAAGGIPLLALGYIGLQFTSNIAHGPAQGLMHDQVPKANMGVASGVKNIFDMAGLVLSSLVMGRIFSPAMPQQAFLVIALVLLGAAAFTIFGVREQSTLREEEDTSLSVKIRSSLKVDTRAHPVYWRLIVARLAFLVGVYGIQAFAQYFIRDTLQVDDPIKLTNDVLAAIVLALIGFAVIAGYLCDRFGRKPMHILAAILVCAGSILMAFADTPIMVVAYGSIVGAGVGTFLSANWALANDLAPRAEAGKYLGLTNIATAGAAALSRLYGPVIDAVNNAHPGQFLGYDVLFVGAALTSILSMVLLRKVPDRITPPAEESNQPDR